MRVVIFGGGGFVGSAVVDRFLIDGHYVRVFDRPNTKPYRKFLPHETVEWVFGDVANSFEVSSAISGMDVIVHLVSATLPNTSNVDPVYDVESNLISTIRILDQMVKQNVRKIIFISSGGTVYGNPVYLPIDENHPTNPVVSYGITKLAVEKYLMLYQHLHGIDIKILRVSNPFGERQRVENAQGVVGVFLNKILNGVPITIWGDGSVVRDYIYIYDLADAFSKVINYNGDKLIFNIGSGIGVSINELIQLIELETGVLAIKNYIKGRPYDVKVSVLDTRLANIELGWVPKFGLSEAIKQTANWFAVQDK